jgi:hypothetical protein
MAAVKEKTQHVGFRLPVEIVQHIDRLAASQNLDRTAIITTALRSFFSGDDDDRHLGVLVKRLDHHTRQTDKLYRAVELQAETVAQLSRFLFAATPPIPEDQRQGAQAHAEQRFQKFCEGIAQRIQRGDTYSALMVRDFLAAPTDYEDPTHDQT